MYKLSKQKILRKTENFKVSIDMEIICKQVYGLYVLSVKEPQSKVVLQR